MSLLRTLISLDIIIRDAQFEARLLEEEIAGMPETVDRIRAVNTKLNYILCHRAPMLPSIPPSTKPCADDPKPDLQRSSGSAE